MLKWRLTAVNNENVYYGASLEVKVFENKKTDRKELKLDSGNKVSYNSGHRSNT